jgi:hypothetical protein
MQSASIPICKPGQDDPDLAAGAAVTPLMKKLCLYHREIQSACFFDYNEQVALFTRSFY